MVVVVGCRDFFECVFVVGGLEVLCCQYLYCFGVCGVSEDVSVVLGFRLCVFGVVEFLKGFFVIVGVE